MNRKTTIITITLTLLSIIIATIITTNITELGSMVTAVSAALAVLVYQKQASIADTANLMILWQERNRIFDKINDINNKYGLPDYMTEEDENKKELEIGLIYFDLIMLFEQCCTFYFKAWTDTPKMQDRFHALFDEDIEANLRKHFLEALCSLKVINNRFIYEYGLTNLHKYCIKRAIIFRTKLGHENAEDRYNKPTNIVNLISEIDYSKARWVDGSKLSKYIVNLKNEAKSIEKDKN